jgi:nucleotide-binding universal stress UspA family protein
MSTVLLATDGSDLATAAITQAVELLGRDHRYVTIAVVPPAFVPAAGVAPMDTHPQVLDPQIEQQIERQDRAESTQELAELADLLAITAEPHVEVGDPGPTICDLATEIPADVVVVGSHGHGWLQRVFLGSVSTHVLHHAPCPVLVVRITEAP